MPFSVNYHVVPTMWFLENLHSKAFKTTNLDRLQEWQTPDGLWQDCSFTDASETFYCREGGKGRMGKLTTPCELVLVELGHWACWACLQHDWPDCCHPEQNHRVNTAIHKLHKLSNGALTHHLNDEGSLIGFDWFCQGHSYEYCSERHMVKDLSVLWPCLHQMSKRQDCLGATEPKEPFRHSNSN